MMDDDRGNQGGWNSSISWENQASGEQTSGGTCINKRYKEKNFQGQRDGSVCKVFVVQD